MFKWIGTYFVFILILSSSAMYGQYIEAFALNKINAEKMMEIKNYPEAVRQFSALHEEDPNSVEYQLKLGTALTYSNIDQAKGLKMLEQLYQASNKPKETAIIYALALRKNYQYEKAIDVYNKIRTNENALEIDGHIEACKSAIKLYAQAVAVDFENLGKNVNSKAPDYLPVVTPDESAIIFSSRRDGVVGNLYDYGGYRTADILMSKHKRNKYSRARSIGSPNTYGNEESAAISENGQYVTYHVDSDNNFSDIYVSQKGKRSFMPPKEVNSEIVNAKSAEPGAVLTNDGKTMYFCSDREGGYGGFDIYMVKKLPHGVWGEPLNLGKSINTEKDEMYPSLRDDGNTLYFSSDGYESLGGLDIFKSVLTEDGWTKPANIGYPINSSSDDFNISFSENPRYAYISAKRDDSFGDLDIYRIIFLDEQEELSLLEGKLMTADSSIVNEEVIIEIFNRETEELYGSYLSKAENGKYHAILPPGKYRIEIIDTDNYSDYELNLNLLDKNDFVAIKKLNIILKPRP